MSYENQTKNQHYISQVEQRFNSINGNEKKIYSFFLDERESCKIRLEKVKGKNIEQSLSFTDLYTYDFLDAGARKNYEESFFKYEARIKDSTLSFMNKLNAKDKNIIDEVIDILSLKFLNFIRNPFNIKKSLNTFGLLAAYVPTDKTLQDEYKKLEKRDDDGISRICRTFGVSKEEYYKWMRVIFLSLMDASGNGRTMLDDLIANFITDKSVITAVWVYNFGEENADKKVCLSDRSFVDLSDGDDGSLIMAFNLTANCFIKFALVKIDSIINNSPDLSINIKDAREAYDLLPKQVVIRLVEDCNEADEALKNYNFNAVYQCHERVYCAINSIYGL